MPDPLPVTALHHLSYQVSDLDQSLAFYRDVLGFRPVQRPALRFRGAWLFRHGLQIHLIADQAFAATEKPISSTDDHIAFLVDDLTAVEAHLAQLGVAVRVNIQSGSGLKQVFFHDPDGRTIEMAEYPPTPRFLDETEAERAS